MANSGLVEAFSDCVDRLIAGQSIDECLAAYPQYAAELRVLLEAGVAVHRAAPPIPLGAKARVRAQVMQAAVHADASSRRSFLPASRFMLAAAVLAVAILTIVLIANLAQDDSERLRTEPILSATVTATLESPTPVPATATATESSTSTPSPTWTLSPTRTATRTPPPTRTPTFTASPSPTPTACVATSPDGWVAYSIQSGDSLSAIAATRGISIEQLQRVNCLADPDLILPGQTILVPPLSPAVPVPTATNPPPPPQDISGSSGPGPSSGPSLDDSGDDNGDDDHDDGGGDDSGHDDRDDGDDD